MSSLPIFPSHGAQRCLSPTRTFPALSLAGFLALAILSCSALSATPSLAAVLDDDSVGMVKTASGEASIKRDGVRLAAHAGDRLLLGDVLATGANGALGVMLRDDTVLSLGPSTETGIEEFVFEPARRKLAMVLRVTRGMFAYISGKISKLAPGSVRIETPVATLGVRGTHIVARIVP